MPGRIYYAYWLDPEYMNPRAGTTTQLARRKNEIIGAIKTMAVLGEAIALSDVQLIDSRVVLELFSDQEFRRFVYGDRTFLRLVSNATSDFGAVSRHLSIVENGLARTFNTKGWMSSAFKSPQVAKNVARIFKKQKPKDMAEATALLELGGPADGTKSGIKDSHEKDMFIGMLEGLRYFLDPLSVVTEAYCDIKQETYYSILKAGVDLCKDSEKECKVTLNKTFRLVEELGERFHFGRGPIIQHLEKNLKLSNPNHMDMYLTVIHAWNVGVQGTVNPTHASAFQFKRVPALAADFHKLLDFTIPVSVGVSDVGLFEQVWERFLKHPAEYPWGVVAEARKKWLSDLAIEHASPWKDPDQEVKLVSKALKAAAGVLADRGEHVPYKIERTVRADLVLTQPRIRIASDLLVPHLLLPFVGHYVNAPGLVEFGVVAAYDLVRLEEWVPEPISHLTSLIRNKTTREMLERHAMHYGLLHSKGQRE